MTQFTPVAALIGGSLIGLASVLLLWLNGRIAGISGIANGVFAQDRGDRTWRWLFLAGLIGGAWISLRFGVDTPVRRGFPAWLLAVAGLLVGYGSAMANGCTSGHGVCGLARLSPRSLAATVAFLAAAFVTTFVVRHVLGAAA